MESLPTVTLQGILRMTTSHARPPNAPDSSVSSPMLLLFLFHPERMYLDPCRFCLVKAMVFPVVIYGCESWTVKKAECRRFDAFELWCWRRLLRVPWTASRPNQSILKEISPEHSLERLLLMLKLQYFGDLMPRADSFEKTLMLGD